MAGAREIRAGRAFVEIGAVDRMARGLRRAQAKLRAFGAGIQRIGMRIAAASALFATPLVAGVKVFADLERQMAMVSTMLDRPAEHMETFKRAVRAMSVEFGESTETITKGLYDLLSASVAPEKALKVLRVALQGAKAGMTDTATSTKALVRILRAYDQEAATAADISDLLFTVVKKGVITYEELAEHVGSVAPSARAAGLSLEQLAGAIATVVAVEEPARAMTALRQAIFEAAEEGTDLLSFVRKFEGADLARVIAAGIPKRAAQGVVILAGNLELLDKNLAAMAGRAGATEEAYRKMAGTLSHAFAQIRQAGVVALGMIGEALAEPVARAAEAIKRYAAWVTDFIGRNKELITTVAKVIALVGAAGIALVALGLVVKTLAFGLGAVAAVLVVLKAALLAAISPIGLIIATILVVGHATGVAGKALAWLRGQFGRLAEFAGQIFGSIKDALAAGDVQLAARVFWSGMRVAWEEGCGWLTQIWEDWRTSFLKIAHDAFSGLEAAATLGASHVQGVLAEMGSMINTVWTVLGGLSLLNRAWVREKLGTWSPERAARERRAAVKHVDARLAGIRGEAKAELERIKNTEKNELAAIGREAAERRRALDEDGKRRKKRAEAESGLARALGEYEAARREAAEAAFGRRILEETGPPGPPESGDVRIRAKAALSEALEGAVRSLTVRGTYSGMMAERMAIGGPADRIADATEETAENTRRLLNEVELGEVSLTFD